MLFRHNLAICQRTILAWYQCTCIAAARACVLGTLSTWSKLNGIRQHLVQWYHKIVSRTSQTYATRMAHKKLMGREAVSAQNISLLQISCCPFILALA